MHTGKLWLIAVAALATFGPVAGQEARDRGEIVGRGVSVTDGGSAVRLDLGGGEAVTITFTDGVVRIDGQSVGRYTPEQERVWRRVLSQGGWLESAELLGALSEGGEEMTAAVAAAASQLAAAEVSLAASESAAEAAAITGVVAAGVQEQLQVQLEQLQEDLGRDLVIDLGQAMQQAGLAQQLEEIEEQLKDIDNLGFRTDDARIHMGDLTVRRSAAIDEDLIVIGGDVSIFGRVEGNVVAVDGDVIMHKGGLVTGDLVTINGEVNREGGRVLGDIRTSRANGKFNPRVTVTGPLGEGVRLASLLGMFVALASIGFGFTFFMPRPLQLMSETVTNSFGKSFLAGAFAQPLLPPLFAMLMVGLAITVVGILVIPFAIVGSILFVLAAGTGGYLSVANAVGSAYLTRRMAQGHAVVVTPYRGLVYGLVGLMAIWLPAVLLGSVPFVGTALALLAAIFTWVVATAGFGAAILSRAGLRQTFADYHRPALTDEFYWPADTGSHQVTPRSESRNR